MSITELNVEEGLLDEVFAELGYETLEGEVIGPDGTAPERTSNSDVLLMGRLEQAVARLNPDLPPEAHTDAINRIVATETPSLVEENRRIHRFMVEGVPVEVQMEDGTSRGDSVRLFDFAHPGNNDFLAVNQFVIVEGEQKRRPDVVVFVNGMPLAVIELKNPIRVTATLSSAYNQLQTYKTQIGSLFRTNAALVISDGLTARIGSLTADEQRFMPWRTVDGPEPAVKDELELWVLTRGVFEKGRLLDMVRNFIVFQDTGAGLVKIIAGYHQFHAVHRAVEKTVEASSPEGDRKVGVIWHTQGSGKSLLMAFYAGLLVQHPQMRNPTIVVVTDRNDLDDQLFNTFSMCRDLVRQTPIQAESMADLREKLNRVSGGVVFATIQKFAPTAEEGEVPLLSDRRNVVVIADEAHRSQYGLGAKLDGQSGRLAYGFAKYLRDALPNASFIGFTGTPIEKEDVNTPAVFGDYIDIYDISQAVDDGTTVGIDYESRLARIELPKGEKAQIDALVEGLIEDAEISEQERIQRQWSTVEALVGAEKRLAVVAQDLVTHFENRLDGLDGKAMVVCMNRRICIALYKQIIKLRPEWHSDDDLAGVIKIVITGNASDPLDWQQYIGNKSRRDKLAWRAKDPDDPLKIVIVCDMWLTGFDAPCMHTMYIDKPMRGHSLMQAIARVNRVFKDKPAGLVVDYIGVAQRLKTALAQYSKADQRLVGVDISQAIAVMLEKYEIVRDMFHGFDYSAGLTGEPMERLGVIASAMNWMLEKQHQAAERETSEEAKAKARRRFQDAVLALSKAFALAAASDEAREIRDEVAFFQAVRAAMIKVSVSEGKGSSHLEFAIQQILDQSLVSTGVIDLLQAAGLTTPDISILSEEFLADIQKMKQKNLALEALRKLLTDHIASRGKMNVAEARKFSERLDDAIARYHTNAITTAEVLQELIELAQDIRDTQSRGEEQGLTPEEVAFYDALSENKSAVEAMGDEQLMVIAQELTSSLKQNVKVDWQHKESTRASMRVLVKKILQKHGYPPDMQPSAVRTVLEQAEALAARWTQ